MVKEILLANYGYITPNRDLKNKLKEKGYKSIFEVKARQDVDIINYIKTNFKYDEDSDCYRQDGMNSIFIDKVDISKNWIIESDSETGNEYIAYLKLIDKDLNLYGHEYSF